MRILGISCYYHDAAAAIVEDGRIVAASMEERYSRLKHDIRFPVQAVLRSLDQAGLDADGIDAVAFYETPYVKFERILKEHLEAYPRGRRKFIGNLPAWMLTRLPIERTIRRELRRLELRAPVHTVRHHLAHAASAYYPSAFGESAILTIDGVGEYATTAVGRARENSISLLREIRFPHSLGLLYSTFTQFLGFRPNNAEYKVMGLSAYGRDTEADRIDRILALHPDGSFTLDLDYFDFFREDRMHGDRWISLFGPPRRAADPVTEYHQNLACSLQRALERAVLHVARGAHEMTGLAHLCFAGGVALNSVANARILSATPFRDLFVPPAPGDDGGAIGAALALNHRLDRSCPRHRMRIPLGPAFTDEQVAAYCRAEGIAHRVLPDDAAAASEAARRLAEGEVVGWFQGGMEWGPRSLGYRSILADPRRAEMKEILNEKVKHREAFRPFAPSILAERVADYFEIPGAVTEPCEYMLMVYPVREEKRAEIPAVTHVDGTGRLHAVTKESNPLFHALIRSFADRTGVPVVINTSFNVRGEPIVCVPHDAFRCLMKTDIDALVMGRILVEKAANRDHPAARSADPVLYED